MNATVWKAISELEEKGSVSSLDNEAFEVIINAVAQNNMGTPIENRSEKQAMISMKHIFLETKHELGFFAGSFSGKYSSQPGYLESLKGLLKPGVTVNVLLERTPEYPSEALNSIMNHISSTGVGMIGIASDKSIQKISEVFTEAAALHFVVSDKKRYWIETDPINNISDSCFSDHQMGELLSETICEAMNFSTRYTPI